MDKIDYDGNYKYVLIKNKIKTDNPVFYQDKEYLSVKYIKQEYKSHIEYDYEKNGMADIGMKKKRKRQCGIGKQLNM